MQWSPCSPTNPGHDDAAAADVVPGPRSGRRLPQRLAASRGHCAQAPDSHARETASWHSGTTRGTRARETFTAARHQTCSRWKGRRSRRSRPFLTPEAFERFGLPDEVATVGLANPFPTAMYSVLAGLQVIILLPSSLILLIPHALGEGRGGCSGAFRRRHRRRALWGRLPGGAQPQTAGRSSSGCCSWRT